MTTMLLGNGQRAEALGNMLNVREERQSGRLTELRENKSDGTIILEGYAATFEPYDCNGGPNLGGWIEQLSHDCFDETLGKQPDLQLLINHGGEPLARTKSGTMRLSADRHGLRVWAKLDASDPDVKRLIPKMRRGDMDEMSFAFRVTDQDWDTSYTHRTIRRLTLEKGDVSVVNYGMNPGTRAMLADAVSSLASLSPKELTELRGKLDTLGPEKLRRAAQILAAIATEDASSAGGARPAARKSKSEPYGDVKYADPGYKSDGKKRYPINTADHVKAAWSYINMPKNQSGYSSAQVKTIKSRIRAAAKKFGIDISEDKRAMPMPDAQRPSTPSFKDEWYGAWNPNDSPLDPHDEPYDEGMLGTPDNAPVPANIDGSSGPFNGAPSGSSTLPTTDEDPHDLSYDEEMLSMDGFLTPRALPAGSPQDMPYDLGPQVGGVEGDRPNTGEFPQGPVADNIVTAGTMASPLSGMPPMDNPDVGMGRVDAPARQTFDWTGGPIGQPADPEEELDAPVMRAMDACDKKEMEMDSPECKDIDGDADEVCGTDVEPEECDMDEECAIDLRLAEALDRTIVHAYSLSKTNEARKYLVAARRQLHSLVNGAMATAEARKNPAPAKPADNEVMRKFAELRKQVGSPDTGTVAECLQYVRTQGSAPVGYGGLLDHDPGLHVVTARERLERDKAALAARKAAVECETAESRLRQAQREAELNDVIRRHNIKAAL